MYNAATTGQIALWDQKKRDAERARELADAALAQHALPASSPHKYASPAILIAAAQVYATLATIR